jgi:hypothetical protein
VGNRGLADKGGARGGLRHDGPCRKEKEEKGDSERDVEKAAGDERTFISSRASDWQMG